MSSTIARKFLFILCLFPALLGGRQTASAQLSLSVDAPKSVGEDTPYFFVAYKIASTQAKDFAVGSFSGFDVLAGPSVSVRASSSTVNGRTSSQSLTTFTYTLAPTKQGKFTIPAAGVSVAGKTYRSKAVTITVTAGSAVQAAPGANSGVATQQQNNDIQQAGAAISDKDLYVSAKLGRTTVYEQEAVPLTYRFYAKAGVGLSNIGLNQKPDFKGIVSQELATKNIQPELMRIGDATYRTGIVQQYILFPQQSGSIALPPLTFQCHVVQREKNIDPIEAFFNGGGHISRMVERSTNAETLVVKPLPSPKPTGFSGGVGQFEITGRLLSPTVRTNEVNTYRLTLTGRGNLQLITAPTLTFPTDFETYSPKTNTKTEITSEGVTGTVTFDYTFVPRNLGEYEIPSVDFIFFDPEAAEYRTISAPAQSFIVEKGTRSEADLAAEEELRKSDIRPISEGKISLSRKETYYWWGTAGYWSVYLILLIMAFAGITLYGKYRRVHADTVRVRSGKAAKVASRRLKHAEELLKQGNTTLFYTELAKALQTYLYDKLNLPVAEQGRERIREELAARGVDEAHIAELQTLLDDCEYVRFAPSATTGQADGFFSRAVAIILAIESSKRPTAATPKHKYTI